MFLFATLAEATQYVNFHDLMGENSEIAFSVFGLPIRWYALAYLAGIFLGYWYLLKLIDQPGAPMARRHADDMIFYAMLGIILGGRLGRRLPARTLGLGFAALLGVTSVAILAQTLTGLITQ